MKKAKVKKIKFKKEKKQKKAPIVPINRTVKVNYREKGKVPEPKETGAGKWILPVTVLAVALALSVLLVFLVKYYEVTTVYVEGNVHYTNDEIMDMVMDGVLGHNSLYLTLKYRNKPIRGIPFVESMDVSILSPDTIRISVYEKALAGYVEYLGRYMYFDKDGIIVENSDTMTAGIPQVTGLNFGYVVMYEKLPVENDEIFHKILDITQLLTKYNISADKLYFDSGYEVTLYFEKVRVKIGTTDKIDEKIMKLQYILPEVEGKSGVFRMENYSEDSRNITFELD